MKFRSAVTGTITKIRFYKAAGETGTHTGRIWSVTGTQLASVVFTGETASSWQEMALSTPLSILANTTYVVSVNANITFVFTEYSLQTSIVNGVLSSVADGINGLEDGTPGTFPTATWNQANYFRDIVFSPIVTDAENTLTMEDVKVYPNPSNGIINIEAPEGLSIEINNMLDLKIYTGKLNSAQTVINLSGKSGMYLININKDDVIQKVIVQ